MFIYLFNISGAVEANHEDFVSENEIKPVVNEDSHPELYLQPSKASDDTLDKLQFEKLFNCDDGWEKLDASFKNAFTKKIRNAIKNDKNNNIERVEFCKQMLGKERLEFLDELKQVQLLLDLKKHSDKKIADEVNVIIKEFDKNLIESDNQKNQVSEMDLFPERSQIQRQYPISSHVTTSSICQDENEFSDDSSEYLDDQTEFVRNGFGRMSTMSTKSVGPGSENFKSVDEITISRSVVRKPSAR